MVVFHSYILCLLVYQRAVIIRGCLVKSLTLSACSQHCWLPCDAPLPTQAVSGCIHAINHVHPLTLWLCQNMQNCHLYSGHTHRKWWYSNSMLNYQKVSVVCHSVAPPDSWLAYTCATFFASMSWNLSKPSSVYLCSVQIPTPKISKSTQTGPPELPNWLTSTHIEYGNFSMSISIFLDIG